MKPVDAHCHLDFDRFDSDRETVIEKAGEKLEFVVNAGRDFESNKASIKLQEEFECVVANLGLHPTNTEEFSEGEKIEAQIREEEPAAIGEIGLDHHHVTETEKRKEQEIVFRDMLELAEELRKPVVVHSREVEEKAVEILQQYSLPGVMLHCFNGNPEIAEKAAGGGIKIGVTTQVLYSSRVQEIVERLEVENILLETDSPFLYRGGRNEPVNVIESVKKIAELKGIKKTKVVSSTTRNAEDLFR